MFSANGAKKLLVYLQTELEHFNAFTIRAVELLVFQQSKLQNFFLTNFAKKTTLLASFVFLWELEKKVTRKKLFLLPVVTLHKVLLFLLFQQYLKSDAFCQTSLLKRRIKNANFVWKVNFFFFTLFSIFAISKVKFLCFAENYTLTSPCHCSFFSIGNVSKRHLLYF